MSALLNTDNHNETVSQRNEYHQTVKRLKGVYSWFTEISRLRAKGRHLPYGITECYLPPYTSEHAPP